MNPDAGSKPHADSISLKGSGSSKGTTPGNTEPGSEDVNGGCTSSYKGTSFYFVDELLLFIDIYFRKIFSLSYLAWKGENKLGRVFSGCPICSISLNNSLDFKTLFHYVC